MRAARPISQQREELSLKTSQHKMGGVFNVYAYGKEQECVVRHAINALYAAAQHNIFAVTLVFRVRHTNNGQTLLP